MKKGLSVLLIAAALFGFYGGAVNLNDVLACKDYWEEEGERSTADMNKLEDGLNQLKENEQAYLDGVEQIADGEIALAEGEAAFADGQATLAQGEADYAAAPGKLADARRKLAKGENDLAAGYAAYNQGKKDLAAGKQQLKGLAALINGISKILNGYKTEWKPGYEALRDNRAKIYNGSKGSKDDLTALAVFLDESSRKSYVAAVNDVAGDDGKQTAKDYKDFIKSTNVIADSLPVIQTRVKALTAEALRLYKKLSAIDNNVDFAQAVAAESSSLLQFAPLVPDKLRSTYVNGINDTVDQVKALPQTITNMVTEKMQSDAVQSQIAQTVAAKVTEDMTDEQKAAVKDAVVKQFKEQITEQVTAGVKAQVNADEDATSKRAQLVQAVGMLYNGTEGIQGLKEVNEKVNGESSAINNKLLPGLRQFNAATADQDGVSPVDKLSGGQNTIEDGVRQVAAGALSSDTLKSAIRKKMGASAITLLSTYKNDPSPLNNQISDFGAFYTQMEKSPGLVSALTKAQSLLRAAKVAGQDTVNDGEQKLAAARGQLAAGERKLAAGRRQYAQGLADYKAAPAKLAEGRAKLADAAQQLADGRKELADGKEKLAEYEDGEQQVRDGLATLMGTEPDGGLTSILDRRNGDADFDNGDGHLELDEGLEAVTVGRGYQADSGELITKEITGRAVGTAAGLGAGALAVLAAILSFLKKNKGAGVCAILAAAAGAAGIAYGTSAGMEFSNIAGSTVGAMPWVAAGVLAAVAAVHAVTHFASKEA